MINFNFIYEALSCIILEKEFLDILENKVIKIPLVSYIDGYYRFYCRYDGFHYEKCLNNENGICKTKYKDFPLILIHKFDNKNIIKCLGV